MFFKSIVYNYFVFVFSRCIYSMIYVIVRHAYWSDSTPRQLVSVSLNPLKRCSGCWGNPSRWWKKSVYGSKWLERNDTCLLTVITCLFRVLIHVLLAFCRSFQCKHGSFSKRVFILRRICHRCCELTFIRYLHTIFVHINLEGPYRMIWDQLSCVRESDAKAARQRFLHLIHSLMNTSDLWRCL